MREQTKETITAVIRHLRAGIPPKEVAFMMKLKWECVQQIIYRHQRVREVYVDTYFLRYPKSHRVPDRITRSVSQAS